MDLRKIMDVSADQLTPNEFVRIEGIEEFASDFAIL